MKRKMGQAYSSGTRQPVRTGLACFALLALAAGSAACSADGGQPSSSAGTSSGASSSQSTSAPATSPAGSAAPSSSPSCPAGAWQTGPVSVQTGISIPPVPVATGISVGTHPECRFDRLVISISGALPGYEASFVSQVIADGSGLPVSVPGTRYLMLRVRPAQGHTDTGAVTLAPGPRTVGYPMLKGYAVAGDFEAVVSIALGLAGGTKYRVSELPGRIYVDVSW